MIEEVDRQLNQKSNYEKEKQHIISFILVSRTKSSCTLRRFLIPTDIKI